MAGEMLWETGFPQQTGKFRSACYVEIFCPFLHLLLEVVGVIVYTFTKGTKKTEEKSIAVLTEGGMYAKKDND